MRTWNALAWVGCTEVTRASRRQASSVNVHLSFAQRTHRVIGSLASPTYLKILYECRVNVVPGTIPPRFTRPPLPLFMLYETNVPCEQATWSIDEISFFPASHVILLLGGYCFQGCRSSKSRGASWRDPIEGLEMSPQRSGNRESALSVSSAVGTIERTPQIAKTMGSFPSIAQRSTLVCSAI